MVLPKTCKQSGIEAVSLYMPQLRDHLTSPESTFADVKRLVKEMGGQTNASCRFLKVTSSPQDTVVDSRNSHVCKSVLQIPRSLYHPLNSYYLIQVIITCMQKCSAKHYIDSNFSYSFRSKFATAAISPSQRKHSEC